MVAGGANFGGFGADDDVSAITTFPDFYFALFKYRCSFDVAKQRAVSFFVVLLDCRYLSENGRKRKRTRKNVV